MLWSDFIKRAIRDGNISSVEPLLMPSPSDEEPK